MAIKRYIADADTTITNAYKANLSTRGVSGNMGQSDILEVFSIFAQASSASSELERILIKFPATGTTTGYISYDRTQADIPASGSVSFYLRLFNAKHSQTVPKNYNLVVSAVSQSWQEGTGLDMEDYSDEDEANWLYASDTKIEASASLRVVSYNNSGQSIQLTGANGYLFTAASAFNDSGQFAIGANNNACATNIYTIINDSASADFSASVSSDIVTIYAQPAHAGGNTGSISSSLSAFVEITGSGDTSNGYLSAAFDGGSDYTLWATQGGEYLTDSSSSFTASFTSGLEDMELDITTLVEQWINSSGNVLGSKSNYGVGIKLSSTEEDAASSYYTKKFFARGSQFFFKRPIIEARWDSSKKDSRGDFYYSSSMAPAADNLNIIYLYNYVRGQLKNIPGIVAGDPIYVSLYSGSAANSAPSGSKLLLSTGGDVASGDLYTVTGGFVSTGIYSASVAFTGSSSLTKVFDVWRSGTAEYFSGTIEPKILTQTWPGQAFNPNQQYVSKIRNLRSSYSSDNKAARLRLYTRKKDWNPNIYSVASVVAPIDLVNDAYYKVIRATDGLEVISYGTGSDNNTRLSYDTSGSYFDLDMSLLESDSTYTIKFIYYLNGQYAEQPEEFTFRVE